MINRRVILAGLLTATVAACGQSVDVSPTVAAQARVEKVVVNMASFQGVEGRQLSVSPDQVQADVTASVESLLKQSSASGTTPVTVTIYPIVVRLISPGQSLVAGGVSTLTAQIEMVATNGEVLVPRQQVKTTGQDIAGAGLIGAATRGTAQADYDKTIRRFGESVNAQLFEPEV